jgi:hypothetical protein
MNIAHCLPLKPLVVGGVAAILLSGCSAFQSSKRMDMSPFSENAGILFVEAAKVSRPFRWNYNRPHLDSTVMSGMRQKAAMVYKGLTGIAYYSNQIVALNTAKMSDKKRNENLASYVSDAMRRVTDQGLLDSLGLDQAAVDTVLTDIREAKTYLDGIAAATPIVNAIVVGMGGRLSQIQAQIPPFLAMLEDKVEADYARRKANYISLIDLRTRAMREMTLVYRVRLGETSLVDTLLREDPSLQEYFPSREKASLKSLSAVESHLTERLARLDTFIHQLDPDVTLYAAKLRELEEARLNVDDRVKVARDAIAVWAQSHRNLGAGIPVPPLIDVTGMAKNLVKTVVPLP